MYDSIAMREIARSMATPKNIHSWRFGEQVRYDVRFMGADKPQYTEAQAHVKARPDCTNYSYIIRQIMLRNINSKAEIVKSGIHTDDHILRPVALFDIAYRDLQECSSWPMSETERRRYIRTMKCCKAIFDRLYRGMSEEQIYLLNEAMEKMEIAIKHDYDILHIQVQEALRAGFGDDELRRYAAKLCVVHVCVDLPMRYMESEFSSKIRELEMVSHNVCLMMRYYATADPAVEGDIDLNRSTMLAMALKAFQNKYFSTDLTI